MYRTSPLLLAVAAGFLISGCATTTLKPAPSAQLVNGDDDSAVAREQGVEVVVETNDWSGYPSTLESEMTPVRATITNNSDHPLKLSYDNFTLSGAPGTTYTPLPPLNIQGKATQVAPYPVFRPRFVYRGFWLSPYYDPYMVGLAPWRFGWHHDPFYYQRFYPRWQVDLPTRDMVEHAIPEGVVEPKGQVSGYFYFPSLDAADAERLTFTAELVDAKTDTAFGSLSIPFVLN